jgi:hypothetical protein
MNFEIKVFFLISKLKFLCALFMHQMITLCLLESYYYFYFISIFMLGYDNVKNKIEKIKSVSTTA